MGFSGYFFHPDISGVMGPLLLTGDGSHLLGNCLFSIPVVWSLLIVEADG